MTRPSVAGVLGPSPLAFDAVLAGLVRAHRHLDADEETRQHEGFYINHERDAALRVLTELMTWLRPTVEAERAGWDAADRADEDAKAWSRLKAEGLDETQLRAMAGDR